MKSMKVDVNRAVSTAIPLFSGAPPPVADFSPLPLTELELEAVSAAELNRLVVVGRQRSVGVPDIAS